MLSSSLKRLNRIDKFGLDDISDSVLAGRSAAHTACWKYLQMGSYDLAIEQAEQIIRGEPDAPHGYLFKARALFNLKRFQESEHVLLQVMRAIEHNDLIRKDVEGLVKLKDELANSRVEILSGRGFREPIDIAEMYWNDSSKPILDLIGFAKGGQGDQTAPMDVDPEIIDIIGADRARQLYPQLFAGGKHKSPQSSSTYAQRRSINKDLSADFPTRDRASAPKANRAPIVSNDADLTNAGLKTALALAEEKNSKYERKIGDLESELKRVYEHILKLNEEKKKLKKKCDTLEGQLDKVVNKGSTYKSYNDDDDVQVIDQKVVRKPTNTAFDFIRNRKRKALVFTNSKYSANTRRVTDALRARTLLKNKMGDRPMRQIRPMPPRYNQMTGNFQPSYFKRASSPFRSTSISFKNTTDERLIRDLTYSRPNIVPTSQVQHSIVATNTMAGNGRQQPHPPGILPMPRYSGTGTFGQGYGYGSYFDRFNRSSFF